MNERRARTVLFLLALAVALSACESAKNPMPPGFGAPDSPADGDTTGGTDSLGGDTTGAPGDTTGGGADTDSIPGFDTGDPGGPSTMADFPRLAGWIGWWDRYTGAEKDTLARFQLLTLRGSPSWVSDVRNRNPQIRLYYREMPQTIAEVDRGRDWAWTDWVRRYATANGWVLLHDNGTEALAKGWGQNWRWGDFTRHCPPGTLFDPEIPELDSRGLTLAEWLATRFIPWFRETRMTGYQGMWWEVVAQEANSYWWYDSSPAPDGGMLDWNRNGIADWTEGGSAELDRFRADWDSVSTWWIHTVRAELGEDYPIIGGGDAYAPPIELFHGFKNEDFLNRNRWSSPFWSWWDEFYTHTSDRPRRGYVHQRDHARDGWNLSVNQIFWTDDEHMQFSDPVKLRQYVRFALGTTLLGDGYFCFYDIENRTALGQERVPWISEYYDLELGSAAYAFQKQVFGADTLYTRYFHDGTGQITGYVAVNPYDHEVAGVPAEDAVIQEIEARRLPRRKAR